MTVGGHRLPIAGTCAGLHDYAVMVGVSLAAHLIPTGYVVVDSSRTSLCRISLQFDECEGCALNVGPSEKKRKCALWWLTNELRDLDGQKLGTE